MFRWVSRLLFWTLLAVLCAAPSAAQVRGPKVVLLLYAAAGLPPAPNSMDTDIRATLQAGAGGPIQVYTELVDLSWATSEQYEERLATLLRDKYASQKIDLIVSVSAPALRFLMKHRSDVFPGLPVVFCGVEAAAVANSRAAAALIARSGSDVPLTMSTRDVPGCRARAASRVAPQSGWDPADVGPQMVAISEGVPT
jgi:hypothetical protein